MHDNKFEKKIKKNKKKQQQTIRGNQPCDRRRIEQVKPKQKQVTDLKPDTVQTGDVANDVASSPTGVDERHRVPTSGQLTGPHVAAWWRRRCNGSEAHRGRCADPRDPLRT